MVVIEVADEVFHGVLWEEGAEFTVELRGEGFVVGEDEGGLAAVGDDIGHGVGFSGTGDAEEHLMRQAFEHAAGQCGDGSGLVAARFVRAVELKGHRKMYFCP